MKDLLWAEKRKMRHCKMLWIAVFAAVMTAVIVFAEGQFVYAGSRYIDSPGWYMTAAQSLASFFVLPAVIALLGCYIICREEQEDTMKSLQIIPVSRMRLTAAKLVIIFGLSILIYLLLFGITLLAEAVLHAGQLSFRMCLGFFKIYLLDGLGMFFAVSPIIGFVARIQKSCWMALIFTELYSFAGLFTGMGEGISAFYPVTAVFHLSGYYSSTLQQQLQSLTALILCLLAAGTLLLYPSRKGRR